MSVTVMDKCEHCGADLGLHDIGDGAAVFILFILCFSLIPLAWVMELVFAPPLFFHVLFCGLIGLGMIAVMLPATKAYIIMLEWRHLRRDAAHPAPPQEKADGTQPKDGAD